MKGSISKMLIPSQKARSRMLFAIGAAALVLGGAVAFESTSGLGSGFRRTERAVVRFVLQMPDVIADERRIPWQGDVAALGWSPDGTKLAVSTGFDVAASVVDVQTGKTLWSVRKQVIGEHSIAFTPDGKYVVTPTVNAERASKGTALDLLDARTGQLMREVKGIHGDRSADAKIPQTFAYDAEGKKLLGVYPKQSAQSNIGRQFFFNSDGSELFVSISPGPGRPLAIYSAKTWSELRQLSIQRVSFDTFALSSNGTRLAVEYRQGKIALFDVPSGKVDRIIDASDHFNSIVVLAFSPDGKRLVSGATGAIGGSPPDPDLIRVWDVQSGKKIASYVGDFWWIWAVDWSPDGQYLAWLTDKHEAILWNVGSAKPAVTIARFSRTAHTVAFSPTGRQLAVGGPGEIMIFDLQQ